ncbi:hypothetical protein HMPREF9946_02170 [Acetobacteraceae bacterium AT-5844]|nr:hypothetical protein HMPREF9946_02170 [Acetobacteraceae bacterium AT-5844]
MMAHAEYRNADGTAVALYTDDGPVLAVAPDDPRLEGLDIAAYEPPPPPPEPSLSDLLAQLDTLRAQIEARLAAES